LFRILKREKHKKKERIEISLSALSSMFTEKDMIFIKEK
jgi:hypothetical protein